MMHKSYNVIRQTPIDLDKISKDTFYFELAWCSITKQICNELFNQAELF